LDYPIITHTRPPDRSPWGISDPDEEPTDPGVVIDTTDITTEEGPGGQSYTWKGGLTLGLV